VGKALKWILAATFALLGLMLSFVMAPTLLECRLFTACHEVNAGYAIVSIFSSEISSALIHEQTMLQIAHSIALTLVLAVVGFLLGVLISAFSLPVPQPAGTLSESVFRDVVFDSPTVGAVEPRAPEAEATLELSGVGEMHEYYLRIGAQELAGMPRGLTVGREDAGLTIDHGSVSRLHARLRARANTFTVEDAGSTNGTRLNGRNLAPGEVARLHSSDRLIFGAAAFSVQLA
jgi:hypothetical protein